MSLSPNRRHSLTVSADVPDDTWSSQTGRRATDARHQGILSFFVGAYFGWPLSSARQINFAVLSCRIQLRVRYRAGGDCLRVARLVCVRRLCSYSMPYSPNKSGSSSMRSRTRSGEFIFKTSTVVRPVAVVPLIWPLRMAKCFVHVSVLG